MNVVYAKNPATTGSLQILENPAKPKRKRNSTKSGSPAAQRRTKRASQTTITKTRSNPMNAKNITGTFQDVAGPALSVVAGQAGATQVTQIVLNMAQNANPTVRQGISIGLPFVAAVFLLGQKNKYVQMAGVGSAVTSLHAAYRAFFPAVKTAAVEGMRRMQKPGGSGYLSGTTTDEYGNEYDEHGRFLRNRHQAFGKAIGPKNSGYLSSGDRPVSEQEHGAVSFTA